MLVLDTNVLVAALRTRAGSSFELVRSAIQRKISIAVSVALALEYEEVVKRAEIIGASGLNEVEIDQILDALLESATLTYPIHFLVRLAAMDPDDDMVIECAVRAGAKAIVTLNRNDLEAAATRHGIRILTPGAALREIQEGKN